MAMKVIPMDLKEIFIKLLMNISYAISKQKLPSMLLLQKKNGKRCASFDQHHSIHLMTLQTVNAAVIVDHKSKQIIISAYDQACLTPSPTSKTSKSHAPSDGKEATATCKITDGNGLSESEEVPLPNVTCDKFKESGAGVSCLNPWGWMEIRPTQKNSFVNSGSHCNWHPLKHAALVAIENAAARDRQLFPSSGSSNAQTQSDEVVLTSDDLQVKLQKVNVSEDGILVNEISSKILSAEVMRPYLCTGFDIYLV